MKKKFFYYALIPSLIFALIGCAKDTTPGSGSDEGESTYVRLVIRDANHKLTKAASGEEQADDVESTLDLAKIKVFIFGLDGSLIQQEYLEFEAGTNTGEWISKTSFKTKSGQKKVFIYSDPNNLINTPPFPNNTQIGTLENVKFTTSSATPGVALPDKISTNDKFLIGSLWNEITNIPIAPQTAPATVNMNIGRLVSKTKLKVLNGITLKGLLEDGTIVNGTAKYRILSVPKEMFGLGRYGSEKAPDVNQLGAVISAAHSELSTMDDGSGNDIQNDYFKSYDWADGKLPGEHFYIVENSHNVAIGLDYGNTTYLQLTFKFTPDPNKVINTADGTTNGALDANGTFYVTEYDGTTTIYNNDPTQSNTPAIDKSKLGSTLRTYLNGMMTYSEAIKDNSATDMAGFDPYFQIVRNHYYELTVMSISNFGETTNNPIDPWIPVPADTYIKINVTVKGWSKITQGIDW